ncbi:MAG: hypothetical protein KBD63_02705, partial [Bacteriovoracaceae bacterium]|nr:hypothetical protein [Bacteriovoracaceae bacterium]
MKTILLLSGGGGTEHEISQVSSAYLQKSITPYFKVLHIEMTKEGKWLLENQEEASLRADKKLYTASGASQTIDYVIPCIHGTPGETGDIQSYLEIIGLPYFGCKAEACTLTFNKVSTKLWLSAANISNTPFVFLIDLDQSHKAFDVFVQWKN